MKELTREQFDKVLSRSVRLNVCRYCNSPPDIVVHMPWYGRLGAIVKCPHCGAETPMHGITECLSSGKTLKTPILYGSMVKGIKKAVAYWNNGLYGYREKGKKDLKDEHGKVIYR